MRVKNAFLSSRTISYLGTILWSSTVMLPVEESALVDGCMDVDEDHALHGINENDSLDDHFGIEDFTEESLRKAQSELDDWFDHIEELGLTEKVAEYNDDDYVAHDFWLTRNGHGAGYWDGDYGDELGRTLTDECKPYGGQHVWVDESGYLHLEDS
jgi:hypothetical protein